MMRSEIPAAAHGVFGEGGRVFLRPLEADDITDRYLAWFRDPEVTRYLDARDISRRDAIEHLAEGLRTNGWSMHAVIAGETGEHIGNVKVGPIRWKHGVSDLVTVIGERAYWGKGLAREAIRIGIRIAFDVYGFRKLSAGIIDGNVGSLKAYTGAGFVVEGRQKGEYLVEGESRDRIAIGCFNPRCLSET